jgi:glucosamine-6-phosphate deaminase
MEVVILPSATEAALVAARIVARLVRANPRAVLGLATGETPRRVYAELVRVHRQEGSEGAAGDAGPGGSCTMTRSD